MQRLIRKVIFVAGAGGIGDELARRYAREGASIVIGDLNAGAARSVADEIVAAGGSAVSTEFDGTNEDSVRDAVEIARVSFGGLDGMHVNFASFADGALEAGVVDVPMEIYDEVMAINTRGYVLCTRHALPHIISRGGGSIVYMSSGAAHDAGLHHIRVAYAMSKAAIHALMRHVAARYGKDGVRANAIAPGIIMHERIERLVGPEFKEEALSRIPIRKRLGRSDDIAAIGALLLADEGAFITGQVIRVDGGATMRP